MGEPRLSRLGVGTQRTVLHKNLRQPPQLPKQGRWEKPYRSAAQVKTTTLLSSHGSTNSLTNAPLTTTEQESTFITYVKVLEDQVTALKDYATMASVQTRLTVGGDTPPPPCRNHCKHRQL